MFGQRTLNSFDIVNDSGRPYAYKVAVICYKNRMQIQSDKIQLDEAWDYYAICAYAYYHTTELATVIRVFKNKKTALLRASESTHIY